MNSDLISRKAAIEAMEKSEWGYLWECEQVINVVRVLPSIDSLSKDELEIICIHLNAFKENLCNRGLWSEAEKYQRIIHKIHFIFADMFEEKAKENDSECHSSAAKAVQRK